MQAIREVALRSDKTTALQQSTPPLSLTELDHVRLLMKQMKANYPNQELTPETVKVWTPLWLSMVKNFGLPMFQAVLMRLLASSAFFPQPHDIESELDDIRRERNRVERDKRRRDDQEREFWLWVDERVADSGKSEQEVLDAVKIPGYIGRKARK